VRRVFAQGLGPAFALLLLATAVSAGTPLTVFVVRHADKPNGEDDALGTLGAARARGLAERLIGEGISEIVASDKRRTQLTAQPLAEASFQLGRSVNRCAANDARSIVRKVERSRARGILVVTHSDVIDDVIESLTGAKVPEPCACEYDRLYRIDFPDGYASGRGRLRLETYGAISRGPSGEPCSALAPIDPATCSSHPSSPRATLAPMLGAWGRCAP
jgi:phosphohistidine phosphatase SixA